MRHLILIFLLLACSVILSQNKLDSSFSFDISAGAHTIESFYAPYGADLIFTNGSTGLFSQFKFNYQFNPNNYLFIGFTFYRAGLGPSSFESKIGEKYPNKELTLINDESKIKNKTFFIGYKRNFNFYKTTIFPSLTIAISEPIKTRNFYILREKGTNYFNRYKVSLVRTASFITSIGTELLFNKYPRFRLNTEIACRWNSHTTLIYEIENERNEIIKEKYLNSKNILTFKLGIVIRINVTRY